MRDLHAETGAYAIEWVNAFAHLDSKLTSGLMLHGGTLTRKVVPFRDCGWVPSHQAAATTTCLHCGHRTPFLVRLRGPMLRWP